MIYKWLCVLGFVSVLVACTSAPVKHHANTESVSQRREAQQAQFTQGKALFLNKQYAAAAAILLPLAKQGHSGAQYTVGYMYHYGYGVPRNEKESVRWIATAAGRGNPQAKQALERINASHDARGVVAAPAPNP